MKRSRHPYLEPVARARAGGPCLSAVLGCALLVSLLVRPEAATAAAVAERPPTAPEAAGATAVAKPEAVTKDPANPTAASADTTPTTTNAVSAPKAETPATPDLIQLSFQGANIEMVAQWLAQTTGKSVVKHPQVQCQLTIMGSKKITPREAIDLVYRALSLEGFSVIESANAILIAPEGKEPKVNPEVLDASRKDIPEGRQRLVKMFALEHISATDLREKVRAVLSDKGIIEVDERANQLIVTDYTENLKLLAELIRDFDVADSDTVVEIYTLKFAEAEELANLIGLILNAEAATPGATGKPAPSGGGGGRPMPPSGSPMPEGISMPPGASPMSSGGNAQSSGIGSQVSAPQVRIWPDRTSNRLIVSAAKSRLPEIQRLLAILDTDKGEDVTARVMVLKNVTATDLVKEISPVFQKMNGKSRKELVEVAANDRANALIILSSEANFKIISQLVTSLDTEDAQEKVIQTFVLKNADAQDVAKQLQELNKDQDSNSRYPYYIFSSSAPEKGRKKISVVADRRRNSLVVQAPPGQMEGLARMIKELDEPITDDSLAPRIFHLKYVSAVDVEDVLNELFLKKQQQRSYYYFYDDYQDQTPDRDVGRLYGKVRITSEPYSNTIIVTSNSKENLAAVEEVLKQLDSPSEAGESTLHVALKFAKASTVANSVNILFAKSGSPPLRPVNPPPQNQGQNPTANQSQLGTSSLVGFELQQESKEEGYFPWLGSTPDITRSTDGRNVTRTVSDLVGRVRAVADLRSNSLLISANVHLFPQILKLIEDLDAPTDQVMIEARLVEVASDFLDKLGVRWSPNGTQVFTPEDYDNSILGHANLLYQQGFGGLTTVNGPMTLGNALTTIRSGVLDATVNMDVLIQFLQKTTDAKVLAEPQINIRDNETGRLFVGQQVPIPQNSQVSQLGIQTTTFTYKDAGVILEVTPHINSAGNVELKIHAESTTVVPGVTVLGGSVFDSRNFRTDLTATDGQTLVLGGIIQKQLSDTIRKTPILGDIPGLGWLFKKKDKTTHEVELMVFLRPKVTRSPEDARELLDRIYQKAPSIKSWNDEADPEPMPDAAPQQPTR